jgi:hypothetical protein
MEVRPRRQPTRTFKADSLSAVDAVADIHVRLEQVGVQGHDSGAMRDDNVVPVTHWSVVHGHHDTVSGSGYGRPKRPRHIDAGVEVRVPAERRL